MSVVKWGNIELTANGDDSCDALSLLYGHTKISGLDFHIEAIEINPDSNPQRSCGCWDRWG